MLNAIAWPAIGFTNAVRHNRASSRERRLFELLEQVAAHHAEALPFRQPETRRHPNCLFEGQLHFAHFANVCAERVRRSLRDADRGQDLVTVVEIYLHLVEGFAVTRDGAEIFIDPDDEALLRSGFRKGLEPKERVVQHLAAADRNVHIDAPSGFAEDRRNIRFDQVGPKGQERSCAVIDNEDSLFV